MKQVTKGEIIELIMCSPLHIEAITLKYKNVEKIAENIIEKIYGKDKK